MLLSGSLTSLKKFALSVDEQVLMEGVTIAQGLETLFSMVYNFELQCQDEAIVTLEYLQR